MISCLYQMLKIDLYYSVNSFLYSFQKLPFFKDLITNDVYQSKTVKMIVGIFGSGLSFLRALLMKFIYYYILYYISISFFPKKSVVVFFHIYFFLTLLGMFINNKLLNTSKKKYFSLLLFQMDGTLFFQSNLLWNFLLNVVFNGVMLYGIVVFLFKESLSSFLILLLLTMSVRLVGEYLNIVFFKKYHYIWYSNLKLYYPIFLGLLACACLPYFSIIIPFSVVEVVTLFFIVLGLYSFISLFQIDDYLFLYKQLHYMTEVMNSKHEGDYLRQAMIEVREKDKKIDTSILEKKKGYDLFNTIFFERHKEILLRSAKRYAIILSVIYVVFAYLMFHYSDVNQMIGFYLNQKLAFFIIIMFYLNRGAIITRAMFFNCDHAMLHFNFYREPRVILELFKKRLYTVIKVNLIPAFVVGIGNVVLLIFSFSWNYLTLFTTFLFIISLSVFFSVHYLVIYYLMQPYNKNMETKKIGYSLATIATYVICFWLKDLVFTSSILSVIGIVIVVLYISLALFLVYKISYKTFKLN